MVQVELIALFSTQNLLIFQKPFISKKDEIISLLRIATEECLPIVTSTKRPYWKNQSSNNNTQSENATGTAPSISGHLTVTFDGIIYFMACRYPKCYANDPLIPIFAKDVLNKLHFCIFSSSEKFQNLANDPLTPETHLKDNILLISSVIELFFDPLGHSHTVDDPELIRTLLRFNSGGGVSKALFSLTADKQLTHKILKSIGDTLTNINTPVAKASSNLLGVAASTLGKGGGRGVGGGGLLNSGSDIWWRRGNIAYFQDEFLIDVTERLDCTISSKGKVLMSKLHGDVTVHAKLSGLPECQIGFDNVEVLVSCGYHQCCSKRLFLRSNSQNPQLLGGDVSESKGDSIKFVPPDGSTVLLRYLVDEKRLGGAAKRPPVDFSGSWNFKNGRGTLTVKMTFNGTSGFTPKLGSRKKEFQPMSLLDLHSRNSDTDNDRPSPTSSCLGGTDAASGWLLEDCELVIPCPSSKEGFKLNVSSKSGKAFQSGNNKVVWMLGVIGSQSLEPSKLEIDFDWTSCSSPIDFLYEGRFNGYFSCRCRRWNLSGLTVSHADIRRGEKNCYKGVRHSFMAHQIEYRW